MNSTPHLSQDRVAWSIRTRFNPIKNLTPERLGQFLENYRFGFLRDVALAWDAIANRDPILKTVIPKRCKAAARNGWEIVTTDESPEADKHKEVLEYFYSNLTATDTMKLDDRGGCAKLIKQMMGAVGMGHAVHEILWQPRPQGLTAEFRSVPLWFFEATQGRLRFLQADFATYGVDMEPDEWLVTTGDGLMEPSSICWMYRNLSLRDWVGYSEKFGWPFVLGKTPAAKDSPEWAAMATALQDFMNDGAMVSNIESSVEMIESKGAGALPFAGIIDKMDQYLAQIWRGNDLGTQSKAQGVGATMQGEESDILEQDDLNTISETLNIQIDRFVVAYHFGTGTQPLARFALRSETEDSSDRDIKIDTFLLGAGAPIGLRDTLERYGRPVPDSDEELLTKTAEAPASSGVRAAEADPSAANVAAPGAKPLVQSARKQLATAVQGAMKPIADRLYAIQAMTNPDEQRGALLALQAELPQLRERILADPNPETVIRNTLASALFNGFQKGPKS